MTALGLLALAAVRSSGPPAPTPRSKGLVVGNVNPPKQRTALAELTGGKVIHHHSGALGGEW